MTRKKREKSIFIAFKTIVTPPFFKMVWQVFYEIEVQVVSSAFKKMAKILDA